MIAPAPFHSKKKNLRMSICNSSIDTKYKKVPNNKNLHCCTCVARATTFFIFLITYYSLSIAFLYLSFSLFICFFFFSFCVKREILLYKLTGYRHQSWDLPAYKRTHHKYPNTIREEIQQCGG